MLALVLGQPRCWGWMPGTSQPCRGAITRGLSSSLLPAAAPFFPGSSSGGRSKCRRWVDEDGEETDDDFPTTYLEAARRPAKAPPPHPLRAPKLVLGAAGWMPFRGLCEAMLAVGRRGTVDRALNLCTASRFSQWMVVSQCANALATVDGSPPPMVMGGVRSSPS